MKRDMDLVRKLLVFFEEKPDPKAVEVPPVDGYDPLLIKYHLVLLHDAGLLRCEAVRSTTSDRVIYVLPFELTWQGHEFLDAIKNDGIWRKIKDVVTSKGGTLTFDVASELAKRFALRAVADA